MFEPTAGRLQLYINSLLVNIYTDRYVGNEGIYIVFAFRANAHNSSLLYEFTPKLIGAQRTVGSTLPCSGFHD